MSSQQTQARPGGMRSLYADLLGPDESSTSPQPPNASSPTDQSDPSKKTAQQLNAAALRFQPLRRPGQQQAAQKPKIKSGLAKLASAGPATATATATVPAPAAEAGEANSASLPAPTATYRAEDWVGDEEEEYYAAEKRQRGGRKKRKKNQRERAATNWDEIYDPSRPTNLEEWWHSDARLVVERGWKDRLYAHRMSRRGSSEMLSSDEEDVRKRNAKFAPPPGLNFAPPPNLNDIPRSPEPRPPSQPQESQPPPPPSAAPLSDDKSGDDAFARRLRMSGAAPPSDFINTPPPPEPIPGPLPPPAPAAAAAPTPATLPVPQSHEQQVYESATISRPPVRYELPAAPEDIPATEAELEAAFADEREAEAGAEPEADPNAPRSLRPGQKGFAERLLAKYGWTKGSGLGANEGGIVNPLQVKVEKAKKRPDSEGGGYVGPKATKAKIVGGKKKGGQEETGKFGAMSDVVVLKGMVDGMDVEKEMAGGEEGGPGLMQEIGEECSSKYGRVERVYIDRNTSQTSIPVFVKFTSQLSALRAVNALEGRVFNGNTITARFYDSDKFEQGVYE